MSRERLNAEVVIVGGGVMGAATAWQLARRGVRAVVCEALELGHVLGSSHGDGRIVRFTYSEPEYLAMARRCYGLWDEIEAAGGVTLLETTGSWECGPANSETLDELVAALDANGIRHQVWDATESSRRFEHFSLPRTSIAVYQKDGAVVRADRAWRTLWRLAEAAGARLLTGTPVTQIDASPRGVTVRSDGVEVTSPVAVLAPGPWAGRLLASIGLDLPLTATRETVAYFTPAANAAASMADHRVGAMPTLIDYHQDPPFYALPILDDPSNDRPGVKVGWHHAGRAFQPAAVPSRFGAGEADDAVVQRIVGYVGDRFPYLQMRPIKTLTCLYTNTPDYHFVLGRHPGHRNVVIGAGFSGHGFKFAPVIGEILADLATGTEPAFDLDLFRPERFTEGPVSKRRIA